VQAAYLGGGPEADAPDGKRPDVKGDEGGDA
jgi:hypothetical protein